MDSERVETAGLLKNLINDGARAYFVGIKGTGMCALAELMNGKGITVSGSDREEVFYTDDILGELGIPFYESFEASHIKAGDKRPDLVIYSAAYSIESNPEIAEAVRQGIPAIKFSDAVGAYSAMFDSTGITGVHGKTTTTALAGTILKGVGLPAQILAGSAFGRRSTLNLGNKYFVAETCEYRRNFLSFHPQRIILTSVESDHQDYYPTYEDIRDAFVEYGRLLPPGGELIYCSDDPGASEVAAILQKEKPEINFIPYGFSAPGDFGIDTYKVNDGMITFRLRFLSADLKVRIPGRHTALNSAAAIALCSSLVKKEFGNERNNGWNDERKDGLIKSLEGFGGAKRRSEILGEAGGILFMDDYGHHPTAIRATLAGLKEFYPKRRLVLSFMSHTFTRTAMLLEEFASSFYDADIVVLHKIYSSAREIYHGGVDGKTLFQRAAEKSRGERIYYAEEVEDGYELMKSILKSGDLFITMGAGDNWRLGKKLFEYFTKISAEVSAGGPQ
jgi:UDP-N-acetylmuramate--alanine ligase